jgi:hypothetical protein
MVSVSWLIGIIEGPVGISSLPIESRRCEVTVKVSNDRITWAYYPQLYDMIACVEKPNVMSDGMAFRFNSGIP